MKSNAKTSMKMSLLFTAGTFLFFCTGSSELNAQNKQSVNYGGKQLSVTKSSIDNEDFDEVLVRKKMKEDGLTDPVIDKLIAQRKLIFQRSKSVSVTHVHKGGQPPVTMGGCPDMGAENGWQQWSGAHGTNSGGNPPTWNPPATNPPPAATANNQIIINTAGTDPCTPGPNPGDPAIPLVAPGFGTASIQLGVNETPGCYAEQIIFPLVPTINDTNFIYAYAMVLYDPVSGHGPTEKPAVEFMILGPTGDTVPCSYQYYVAGPNLPGFYQTNNTCSGFPDTWYRPWTIVGVNLSAYVNQNLTVIITNTDCVYCGHYAQSYWDFQCPPVSGTFSPFCLGQQTTLCGPPSDPSNPYTYNWYINTTPYNPNNPWTSIPGNGPCVTVTPQVGDTFAIHVQQGSGCNFWIPFIPAPTTVIPDFNFAGNCGVMTFTDSSVVSPVSSTNNVVAWAWQFPGGTPGTSSLQNPGNITYPPGSYTVTLTVTTTAGCSNTISHSFTVGGFPTAAFSSTPPCLGGPVTLTDGSVGPAGDPIANWNWSMPAGNPASSTNQNTSTVYNTAGTHSVTLVVTTQSGCKDTIIQQVLVYNPPVALFTGGGNGCAPVCVSNWTDQSTSADGAINSWVWSFPGGSPSAATGANPGTICYNTPGTYGASLIVTTVYGCKDTIAITPLVNVYPWPTAEFCVSPAQAPVTNPVFNFCDMWSSDVVQWTWNFGDNDSDIVSTDPVHSYSATAFNNDFYTYRICVNVQNQYGCYDSVCHTVELIPEFTFYIPNTVTPNGDFINELFYGKSRGVKEYNIWVFDRWGNLIWDCHKEDKNTNWDSDASVPKQEGLSSACKWDSKVVKGGVDMSGGTRLLNQEDVYVWKVRLTDIFDKKHMYVGHVSIVR